MAAQVQGRARLQGLAREQGLARVQGQARVQGLEREQGQEREQAPESGRPEQEQAMHWIPALPRHRHRRRRNLPRRRMPATRLLLFCPWVFLVPGRGILIVGATKVCYADHLERGSLCVGSAQR